MNMKMAKREIVINVDPYMAWLVLARLRNHLSFMAQRPEMEDEGLTALLGEDLSGDAIEVLEEICEKCIVHTGLRELPEDSDDLPDMEAHAKVGEEEDKEIVISIEALKKFESMNPRVFCSDGFVWFGALLSWRERGRAPRTENDVCVKWDSGRGHGLAGLIVFERHVPDGMETAEQFFPGMHYHFEYDSKTNELVITDFEDSLELRIGYDLSFDELKAIQKNVN